MDLVTSLQRTVRNYGNRPAVIDGDTRYTWSTFDERTRTLAAGLRDLGLVPGDRVAILMLNSFRYLELQYGVLRMGGVMVPINTRLAPPEIAGILEDSGARALVVDDTFVPMVDAIAGDLRNLRHVIYAGSAEVPADMVGYENLLAGAPIWGADVEPHEDDLAALFYTGGTTGTPKGVMLTHRNLLSNGLHGAVHLGVRQDDNYLHVAPMFHVADGATGVCYTMHGACHTFLPGFDPATMLKTLQRERVTSCFLVPSMINALLQVPTIGEYDLSSWRTLLYGGSPMAPDLLRRAMAVLPCDFAQGYGQTEAAPLVTGLSADDHRAICAAEPGSVWERRAMGCGQSVITAQVRVVDDQDRDVAPGEIGEIIARGPNVMKGYWNRPDETADALRNGWLRTGDLATIDAESYMTVVDRKKDMIITGGENVFSVEVENVLCAHPAVLEVAVIGVPDPTWGERVHAVVALTPGNTATAEDLIGHCRGSLAGYKLPRSVEFVDVLPKSGVGKIVKHELRAKYWTAEARLVG